MVDIHLIKDQPPFHILRFSSKDNGHTWGEPQKTGQVQVPPGGLVEHVWPQSILRLKDGALLWFAYMTPPAEPVAGEKYPKQEHGRYYTLLCSGAVKRNLRPGSIRR